MAKQGYKIAKEIKDEIIKKIQDGTSVAEAAKLYGISDKTIYNLCPREDSNSYDRGRIPTVYPLAYKGKKQSSLSISSKDFFGN